MTSIPLKAFRRELTDISGRVQHGHERILVARHGKPAFAVVPAEDLKVLEHLEAVLGPTDGGRGVSLATIKKELGHKSRG